MENGILLLTDTTLKLLKQSHPKTAPSTEEVLVPDQPESIHHMKYENTNADAVCKAVIKTKGSGSSGMDADAWKRILTSKQFAESSTDLCTSIANMINMINMTKKLRIEKNLANILEAFLSCRLIPLDKNPGLRPRTQGCDREPKFATENPGLRPISVSEVLS